MSQRETFGSWSLTAATAAVCLSIPLQPVLGYVALRAGDTAAWMTPLIAALLALLLFWPVAAALAGGCAGGNLIGLARAAAGEGGAVLTGVLVTGLLVLDIGLVIRRSTESAVSHLYPHTPQSFAMVALSACVLYGACGGVADLVRLSRILFPAFILSLLVILVGPLPWSNLRNLLPLWGPGPAPLVSRSFGLMGLFSPPLLFLLTAAGQLRDRKRLLRTGALAMGLAATLFGLVLVAMLLVYPLPLGYSVTFPVQDFTRLVTGGRFFERVEATWIIFEFFAIAGYLAIGLHTAAATYAEAFRMASHRLAVPPLITMALVASLFPSDQGQAILWRVSMTPAYVGIGFGLPVALAVLAAVRRRAGHAG